MHHFTATSQIQLPLSNPSARDTVVFCTVPQMMKFVGITMRRHQIAVIPKAEERKALVSRQFHANALCSEAPAVGIRR
jgi:hypothetical protein